MIGVVKKLSIFLAFLPISVNAYSVGHATTTLTLSVCGNSIVDENEQCDVPGETGVYSQTIAGRQCTPQCVFGPYCGDGILQTLYGEECDDGNNNDHDFCSSICKIEPAGSGGGGSSGGNSGGGGGVSRPVVGDTLISISGRAYPLRTINFLLDTEPVGNVRTDSRGAFEFTTKASPGTATLGMWAVDGNGTRSLTLNNTFDVTQGAVTNLGGVILPPTITVRNQNVNPGEVVRISGESVPNSRVELHVNKSELVENTTASANGVWEINLDTNRIKIAEHILRARTVTGTPPLTTVSSLAPRYNYLWVLMDVLQLLLISTVMAGLIWLIFLS
jgi:cysteine-rich repeat protein